LCPSGAYLTNASKSTYPDRNILTIVFLGALLFQLAVWRRSIGIYDESLELYCAEHALRGEVPYRDFWTMYGPAQFYVLALIFKVLGVSAVAGRIYDAVVKAGLVCICFALVKGFTNRLASGLACALILLWMTCNDDPIYNFPIFPALVCSLISIMFLSRSFDHAFHPRNIFYAGLFVGAASVFRHDSGVYICTAEIAVLIYFTRSARQGNFPVPETWLKTRKPLVEYGMGIGTILLPVLILLLWKVPKHDLFYDLIYVPGIIYPKVRSLPFPRFALFKMLLLPWRAAARLASENLIVYFPPTNIPLGRCNFIIAEAFLPARLRNGPKATHIRVTVTLRRAALREGPCSHQPHARNAKYSGCHSPFVCVALLTQALTGAHSRFNVFVRCLPGGVFNAAARGSPFCLR